MDGSGFYRYSGRPRHRLTGDDAGSWMAEHDAQAIWCESRKVMVCQACGAEDR